MPTLRDMLQLAGATYGTRTTCAGWTLARRFEGAHGFVATLWQEPSSTDRVLSIRGTKRWRDCVQDALLLFGREPVAWREGRRVVAGLLSDLGARKAPARLYLTGHSIGGAYASALGLEANLPTVTFNAPGMREALCRSTPEGPWSLRRHNRLLNLCIGEDFIWRLSGPRLHGREWVLARRSKDGIRSSGIAGVLEAWRARSRGRTFVSDSLGHHGLRAFRDHSSLTLWSRQVEELTLRPNPPGERRMERSWNPWTRHWSLDGDPKGTGWARTSPGPLA